MLKLFDKYGKAFRQLSNNELITEFCPLNSTYPCCPASKKMKKLVSLFRI